MLNIVPCVTIAVASVNMSGCKEGRQPRDAHPYVLHPGLAMPCLALQLQPRPKPWWCCAGQLSDAESAELLRNMRLAAPEVDADLVELLARWTMRGRQPAERPQVCRQPGNCPC